MELSVRGAPAPLIPEGVCPSCGKIMGKCGCDITSPYNPAQVQVSPNELAYLPEMTCPNCQRAKKQAT